MSLSPHILALPTLSQASRICSDSYGGLAVTCPQPSDSCPLILTQAELLQCVHAWQRHCTVFHVLCMPVIMLFCILFFSLHVLLEAFLITLNAFLRQLVACWPVYGHFKLNGPWDVPDFPFCKRLWGLHRCLFMFADSSDSLGLPMRMQQCIPMESSPHPFINLFTIYFIRAYYVPVTSGARRSEETYFTSTVGVLPCGGSLVDSKIAYVINHSYYS